MMRFPVRLLFSLLAVAAWVVVPGPRAAAQSQSTTQGADAQAPGNGTYIQVDPLAGVKYEERFDLSLGAAYGHIKAGPPPLQ